MSAWFWNIWDFLGHSKHPGIWSKRLTKETIRSFKILSTDSIENCSDNLLGSGCSWSAIEEFLSIYQKTIQFISFIKYSLVQTNK